MSAAAILTLACVDRFDTTDGAERFASQLTHRLGRSVSAEAVSAYLGGHRLPPLPVAEAMAEELDLEPAMVRQLRNHITRAWHAARALAA